MDETAVYFEDARNQTVDNTGAWHVVIRSTGFASMRITVILAVTASATCFDLEGKEQTLF